MNIKIAKVGDGVKGRTQIFGHRGAAGVRPENTMCSFYKAAEVGSEGLELDVQLSKDGVPVIIHDETLERTTNGQGWVKDYTLSELKQLDAGSWFHHTYQGEKIPTLEEFFEWFQGTALVVNIELKNGLVRYQKLEEEVLALIRKYDLVDRVILSSFNHYSVVHVQELMPEIETAVLIMEGLYKPWNYTLQVGAKGIHCYWPIATESIITRGTLEHGLALRPFTVNDPHYIQLLIQHKCTAIITDFPEIAIKIRGELEG